MCVASIPLIKFIENKQLNLSPIEID